MRCLRPVAALAALLALCATGCVSKSDYETLQQQLTTCETDKKAAQDAAGGFQRRLESDKERWEALNAQLGTVLPQVQADLEQQRKEIVRLVPEQVRGEVGARLDRHFAKLAQTMTQVGNEMNTRVAGLEEQLAAARAEIQSLSGKTEVVETKVSETHDVVVGDNRALQSKVTEQARRASALIAQLTAFDGTYLTCENCPEKLKMKDASRQALVKLHSDVVKALSELQTAESASGG